MKKVNIYDEGRKIHSLINKDGKKLRKDLEAFFDDKDY